MKRILPMAVKKKLEELRNKSKNSITLSCIGNGYYVYESTKSFDKKLRRKIVFNLYKGKIEIDGSFTAAMHRKKETSTDSLQESIRMKTEVGQIQKLMYPDKIDQDILDQISTDGRIPVNEIAKIIGLSGVATRRRLERLEEVYGIRYTIELSMQPFGLFRYIVFVKFLRGMPNIQEMAEVLKKEPRVQFVATLKGDYNLFIYLFAKNTESLEDTIYNIRSNPIFSDYDSYWNVSYISAVYRHLPVQDNFFDLIEERVWKRKERIRKADDQILEREYLVLRELNKNGREEFSAIDAKLGLKNGSSAYTYYKLIDKNIINKVTICMDRVPYKYASIILANQVNIKSFNSNIREVWDKVYVENSVYPTDNYIMYADIGAPYGALIITPLFDINLNDLEQRFHNVLKGTELTSLIISGILVGSLGLRRKDLNFAKKALERINTVSIMPKIKDNRESNST